MYIALVFPLALFMQRFTSNVFPNMSDGEGDETPKLTDAMVQEICKTIAKQIPDANLKKVKIVLLELRDKLAEHINAARQQPNKTITIGLEGDAEGIEGPFNILFTKEDYSFNIGEEYHRFFFVRIQAISPWPDDIHTIDATYNNESHNLQLELVPPEALQQQQSPFVDLGIPAAAVVD